MKTFRNTTLIFWGVVWTISLVFGVGMLATVSPTEAAALPVSDWWLVVHKQCEDTLHWISPLGEFVSIPRPILPDEVPSTPCSYKPMHISQDGRYMVTTATLNSGRTGIGFFDLEAGVWLQVHQTQPNEVAYLGDRYSSDSTNIIAIGFANTISAPRAWRVIMFDMATGSALDELRSGGAEIAGFVGGEFLSTAATIPHVMLTAQDPVSGAYQVQIRFDALEAGGASLGSIAWYPSGAPGVVQEVISSLFTAQDIDLLPNRHAIYAYTDATYPMGPPAGLAPNVISTNAIGLMLPSGPEDISPTPQLFYADGANTFYGPQWAADGEVAVFRLYDGVSERVHWVRMGTALLTPIAQPVTQILGIPTGFVYSTADGIYYQNSTSLTPSGPVYSDPALSSNVAFVWASAFGNPALALNMPASPGGPPPEGILPTTVPPSAGPDLFVSEFSLSPATPVQGQPVEVRIGVYNGGNAMASGTFRIEWYPGENYPAPACDWTLTDLVASGGNILTCTYAGYPSHYASINTRVLIDTTGVVAESNEANNGYTQPLTVNASAPTGQPDLFVSEFSLSPATPVQGQPVEVRIGVYNGGNAIASGTFRIEWYPGENYPAPACDWTLTNLVANGGNILTCTYPGYPSHYASIINTRVLIDTTGVVAESNEANNGYTQPLTVNASAPTGQPDLFVSEFSLSPATPVQGQPVEVRIGVYNGGNAIASGTFRIEWYPGENYPAPACDWTLTDLVANGGNILTCTYPGYPSHYASINTRVLIDTTGVVAESNEANNGYTQPLTVNAPAPTGQPDLFVSEFSLSPATPVRGQPVEVRIGVYNQGNAVASGTFRIEWYPGENYPAPACDWTLTNLVANGGNILTCTYAGYPSHYASINTKVIVDTANVVAESNEGNNLYTQGIRVTSP